jgi:hypothetical protein
MVSRRIARWAILLSALGLALPGTGAAATSRQIYADFAAHGKIQGHYSRAQLETALKDALAEGYGRPASAGVRSAVEQQLNTPAAAGALPFTGADLTLIALGGGVLLGLGGTLRRVGRNE